MKDEDYEEYMDRKYHELKDEDKLDKFGNRKIDIDDLIKEEKMKQPPVKGRMFWIQGGSTAHRDDDSTLERMARRLGKAGCHEVIIGPWWEWGDGFGVLPFIQSVITGKWMWKKPNLQWDENLKRLRKILWGTKLYPKDPESPKSRIHLRMMYTDHCGYKKDYTWNAWKYNVGGPKGMYDSSDEAFDCFKELFDRAWDAGIRKYDLGNELEDPYGFVHQHQLYDWVRRYTVRHIKYLMDKGAKPLFTFSANARLGQAYLGIVAEELGDRIVCKVLHGQMLPERFPDRDSLSVVFKYGISCDGLNTKYMGIPDSRKGLMNDAGNFQDSAPKEHYKSVRNAYDQIGGQLAFWEHVPRTIDEKQSPDNLNQHHDINIFWRVPKNIWGIDPRR